MTILRESHIAKSIQNDVIIPYFVEGSYKIKQFMNKLSSKSPPDLKIYKTSDIEKIAKLLES